jgi:hypothetical protein
MNTTTTIPEARDDVRRAPLSTADLAAAGTTPVTAPADMEAARTPAGDGHNELAQLFPPETADAYRGRWDAIQIAFVDDPGKAVREADELVAEVMQGLADSFAKARSGFEAEIGQSGNASTEAMRVTLQRYRSFFQRLLSL